MKKAFPAGNEGAKSLFFHALYRHVRLHVLFIGKAGCKNVTCLTPHAWAHSPSFMGFPDQHPGYLLRMRPVLAAQRLAAQCRPRLPTLCPVN